MTIRQMTKFTGRQHHAADLFRAHREQEASFDAMFNNVVKQHRPQRRQTIERLVKHVRDEVLNSPD